MPGAYVWKKVLGWVFLHIRAPLGNPGGRGASTGNPVGYERNALEVGNSLHGSSVGQIGVGSSTGDFERWLKRALEVEQLSMGALCREPGGRAPLLGTLKDRQKRLWRQASISIRAPLGNMKWGSSTGDF
jgi:hypothetical protein